jgi:hypothetical protein
VGVIDLIASWSVLRLMQRRLQLADDIEVPHYIFAVRH